MNPEQLAFTSMAPALEAPSLAWTYEAEAGIKDSGVQVALTIRSMSSGSSPAAAMARRAAISAMSVAGTCEMRRSLIPLRVVIHSSLVSTIFSRSALLNTAGGRALPQPVISAYRMSGSSVDPGVRDSASLAAGRQALY